MARSLRRLDLPSDYHDIQFRCAELDAHNSFKDGFGGVQRVSLLREVFFRFPPFWRPKQRIDGLAPKLKHLDL